LKNRNSDQKHESNPNNPVQQDKKKEVLAQQILCEILDRCRTEHCRGARHVSTIGNINIFSEENANFTLAIIPQGATPIATLIAV
jgi:hypothetical protein